MNTGFSKSLAPGLGAFPHAPPLRGRMPVTLTQSHPWLSRLRGGLLRSERVGALLASKD